MNDQSRSMPGIDASMRRSLCAERSAALQALLGRRGATALLLETRSDFAWLTVGGLNHVDAATKQGVAPVLILPDRAVVLAPVNESARIAEEEVAGLEIEVASVPWSVSAVDAAAAAMGAGDALNAADVALELESLRTLLSDAEHARLVWLGEAVCEGVVSVLETIAGGETEDEIAAALAARLMRAGIRVPVLLVAADDRITRYRHPLPTATRIERRLMLVVVAERWGLHVAHTQFRELEPSTPDLERAAAALRAVLGGMRAATLPGRTLGDVLRAAQAAYATTGFDDQWTLHHQGGTIGYQPRERIAVPTDRTPIRPGMAFAWNPSVTGLKVEETLYLDADGGQHIVTTTPI